MGTQPNGKFMRDTGDKSKPCCSLHGQLCTDCGYRTPEFRDAMARYIKGETIDWSKLDPRNKVQ